MTLHYEHSITISQFADRKLIESVKRQLINKAQEHDLNVSAKDIKTKQDPKRPKDVIYSIKIEIDQDKFNSIAEETQVESK